MNSKKLKGAAGESVEEREGHGRKGPPHLSRLTKLAFECVHPTGGPWRPQRQPGARRRIVL